MTLERKVDFAIKLLRSIPTNDGPIELSYSGGKDSDVILELVRMSGIPFEAIREQSHIAGNKALQSSNRNSHFYNSSRKRGRRPGSRVFVARPSRNTRCTTAQYKEFAAPNPPPGRNDTTNPKFAGFTPQRKRSAFTSLYSNGRTRTSPGSLRNAVSSAPRFITTSPAVSTSNAASVVSVAPLRPTTASPISNSTPNSSSK